VYNHNPREEDWTKITRNKDKHQNKGTQIDVIKKTHKNYTTYNCFGPLANLKETQPTNVTTQHRPKIQHQTRNTMRNTIDPAFERKLPSIVNGNVNRSQNKCSSKDTVTQPRDRIQHRKSNKHTVKIIGDGHFRDSAIRINQYLNSKYETTGFIKPGATTRKIVTSGEHELQELGGKDVIVLNCGANDIEKVNSISAIITPVINFSQKYSNTNIIVLEIPHRHDLHHKDMVNIRIQSVNNRLKSILSRFKHVTMLDMNITRNYFTKHGLHLNKLGKEWLARKIASQIDNINTTKEVLENTNPIPLYLTETLQENKQTDILTNTTQVQLTQDISAFTHNNSRSSTRIKKTPSSKYNDFLW
jgi:hypothetical protein